MFTPDTTPGHAAHASVRRRTSSLILPEDPSPEDLVHSWTLSARDHAEVLRCRGDANRRRFAVQLCTLRAYGRFLPEATPAPVAITNYLARQLESAPGAVWGGPRAVGHRDGPTPAYPGVPGLAAL